MSTRREEEIVSLYEIQKNQKKIGAAESNPIRQKATGRCGEDRAISKQRLVNCKKDGYNNTKLIYTSMTTDIPQVPYSK